MAKTFEEMNKSELLKLIKDFNLEATLEENSAIASKPSNKEIIAVLEKFKNEKNEEAGSEPESMTEKKPKSAEAKKADKVRATDRDMKRKERVIVFDNQTSQTLDETTESQLLQISWGNRFINGKEFVNISDGEPRYYMRGTIQRLREIKTTMHIQSGNSRSGIKANTRPRFNIQEVAGWTPEEFEAEKKRQIALMGGVNGTI